MKRYALFAALVSASFAASCGQTKIPSLMFTSGSTSGNYVKTMVAAFNGSPGAPDDEGQCVDHARWVLERVGDSIDKFGLPIKGFDGATIESSIIPNSDASFPSAAGKKGLKFKSLNDSGKLSLPDGWVVAGSGARNGVIYYNCPKGDGHVALLVDGEVYDDVRVRTGHDQSLDFSEDGKSCDIVFQLCQIDWGC